MVGKELYPCYSMDPFYIINLDVLCLEAYSYLLVSAVIFRAIVNFGNISLNKMFTCGL